MSNGNVAPQETPESAEIHSVYVCPACEFSSMRIVQHKQVWGYTSMNSGQVLIDVDLWECYGCGFQEHLMSEKL
jgi:hypothetical protein